MRNKRSFKACAAMLCAIAVTAAADTPATSATPRNYAAIPLPLANVMRATSREQYVASIFTVFRALDKNADGLVAAEIDLVDEVERAARRAAGLTMIYMYDLNNDGRVQRTEVEQIVRGRGYDDDDGYRTQVDEVMKADRNGDATIDFQEARSHSPRLGGGHGMATQGRQLLLIDPNKDGRLTAQELEMMTRTAFAIVDLDGSGVISSEEYGHFENAVREARTAYQMATAFHCSMPRPAPGHRFAVIRVEESRAIPTVSVVGQDDITTVTRVNIEPGTEPLHILLASYTPRIWQLRGATNRVAHVAVASTKAAGVVGASPGKVTFLPEGDCAIASAHPAAKLMSVPHAFLTAMGRAPDIVATHAAAEVVALPSGAVKVQKPMTAKPADPTQALMESAALAMPEVVRLDPKAVVARSAVVPYDVLPREAGIHQLLRTGALTFIGKPIQRKLKIVKPVKRLPAGMHGLTFVLAIGVPIPAGNIPIELECVPIDPAIGQSRC